MFKGLAIKFVNWRVNSAISGFATMHRQLDRAIQAYYGMVNQNGIKINKLTMEIKEAEATIVSLNSKIASTETVKDKIAEFIPIK